jgi:hypothetical protein
MGSSGGSRSFTKKKHHTLWLFNGLPWKIRPFLRAVHHLFYPFLPSISIGHGFHSHVETITRGFTSAKL